MTPQGIKHLSSYHVAPKTKTKKRSSQKRTTSRSLSLLPTTTLAPNHHIHRRVEWSILDNWNGSNATDKGHIALPPFGEKSFDAVHFTAPSDAVHSVFSCSRATVQIYRIDGLDIPTHMVLRRSLRRSLCFVNKGMHPRITQACPQQT